MATQSRRAVQLESAAGSEGRIILLIAAAAVAAGIYARVKGLGFSPLATDEYFIARSVQNILERGWPEWACGGWYSRALLLQYSIAPLLWAGLPPEMAVRIPSVLASLAGLPAVYLLARRLGGMTSALIAVALVAVSIWEIEMARFGRMYAPFQAVFLWHLHFLLREVVDDDRRARGWLLVLSFAGALLWEGGVFLLALNFLPLAWNAHQSSPGRRDLPYAATAAVLLAIGLYINQLDSRSMSAVPAVPPDLLVPVESHPGVQPFFIALWQEPIGLLLALLPLALAVRALIEVRDRHSRILVQLALGFSVVLLLIHQYALFGLLAVLLVLARWIELKDLMPSRAPWLWVLALAGIVFWSAFGVLTDAWLNGQEFEGLPRVRLIVAAFLKQPSVLRAIVEPWMEAVPALAMWTALLLLIAVLVAVLCSLPRGNGLPFAVAVILLLLAGVGYADPLFQTTRYSFFVYPAVILAGVAAIRHILGRVAAGNRYGRLATAGLVVVPFTATEDFDLRHLRTVDSPATIFRAGYPWPLTKHYYQRYDFRGASRWLTANADEGDLVLSTVSVFDHYYPAVDYVYRSPRQIIFVEESCNLARTHRWSGLPQIYAPEGMIEKIDATRGDVWLVTANDDLWMTGVFDRYGRELVWKGSDDHLQVWSVRTRVALKR